MGFTLVLDVDQTLVSVGALPIDFEDGDELMPYVRKRPGLDQFLKDMSDVFDEVIIFSASGMSYVKQIIDGLDPEREILKTTFTGKHTGWVNQQVVKDLRILDRDLNKLVWVDDTASLYVYHPHLGIEIRPFNGDPNDSELSKISPLLLQVAKGEITVLEAAQLYKQHA